VTECFNVLDQNGAAEGCNMFCIFSGSLNVVDYKIMSCARTRHWILHSRVS